ncbi:MULTISPECIES: hypothetical protein [unclassified Gordonia (in: high G+C Gram-positive bacteria)]
MSAHSETNGQHPVAVAGFVLTLFGFIAAPVALVALALGHGGAALVAGIVAIVVLSIGIAMITVMTRRMHHGALVPDMTPTEEQHYLDEYRHEVA